MTNKPTLLLAIACTFWIAGCSDSDHDHDHEGHDHADHDEEAHDEHAGHGDIHENVVDLVVTGADASGITAQQANGSIKAGEEGILLVKVGAASQEIKSVRGWIGGDDRTLSQVGLGHYDADESLYDIHAVAPDPLAEDAMWWIEVEMLDGSKIVGSAKPITD